MYNMIEEPQPTDFSTEKYLYFDEVEQELPEENIFEGDEFINNLDVENINNQDFSKLLNSYDLPLNTKQAYEAKFQKAKRIQKREKAKTRVNTPSLYPQPSSLETSEIQISKQETENNYSKEEQQKRKKRISAQTSRDKKKLYVQHIERQNEALKQKCMELQAQNQRLKVQPKQLLSSEKRSSIKSWFIMSLILFSLQKQGEYGANKSSYEMQQFDEGRLFSNAKHLLNEYQKQPLHKKFLDLQQFKHITDISKQEEESLKHTIFNGPKIQDFTYSKMNQSQTNSQWKFIVKKTQGPSFS